MPDKMKIWIDKAQGIGVKEKMNDIPAVEPVYSERAGVLLA
jgi:hypothetical protein